MRKKFFILAALAACQCGLQAEETEEKEVTFFCDATEDKNDEQTLLYDEENSKADHHLACKDCG